MVPYTTWLLPIPAAFLTSRISSPLRLAPLAARRSAGILLWNLLNEALRECDHIDESFEAIIAPMLSHFETGEKIVSKDDHRMATALKSEMSAISRQVRIRKLRRRVNKGCEERSESRGQNGVSDEQS